MCPEFLREGTAVSDFFDPPLVVVGAGDPPTGEALAELFSFMGKPVRYLDVRGAESLKYACNAYHAVKVSFANEMGRIFRGLGVDSREVMQVFCEDRSLNISGAYLRPGFAFGGSCLPKDLRSLLHMARMNSLDVPLLAGTVRTNELVIGDVLDRVVASDARVVAMIGLSFKADTDDLRESPNVDLVERLIGKGFEVRIYDPIVNPERLTGANLRYVTQRLPHLGRLLHTDPAAALNGCDLALVSSADHAALVALEAAPPPRIIDLHGRLGRGLEQRPGYEGIGWVA
jgi:GDP-mannose 6-dehydrogenase